MADVAGEVRLEIEGVETSLGSIWIYHQRDPYPGGLRYRLIVPRGMADQWVGGLLGRTGEGINAEWARKVLGLISGMLSWVWHEGAHGGRAREGNLTHVLNTIDTVEESESSYTVGGVCSPFIRG